MISILLATYNGGRTIGRFLSQLCEVHPPACAWELILVDNGSTDNTMRVAKGYESRIPMAVLEYPKRGKNGALNHGLKQVCGDLVLFTDDDILPDDQWLVKVWECASNRSDADLFGGKILPCWEQPPPTWLDSAIHFGAAFGVTPATLVAGPISPGAIWGANMFIRRRVFDAGLRFNERVGPGVGNYVMGGDTEFTERAASMGYQSWHCPDVRVSHIIEAHQLERRWLLKRAYRHGKSMHANNGKKGSGGRVTSLMKIHFGFPRWMLRQALNETIGAAKSRLAGDQAGELRCLWGLCHLAGYMAQARYARSSFVAEKAR